MPYASLSYCFQWVKDIPTLKVDELEKVTQPYCLYAVLTLQVEHRSILNNREFFQRLISYVAIQDQPIEVDDDVVRFTDLVLAKLTFALQKHSIDQPIGDVDIDFTKLGITPHTETPQPAAS